MEEIATQFKEEYTELLSRYKGHLSNAQVMSILQSVTAKQIGFKDNPDCAVHNLKEINGLKVPSELLESPGPEFKKMLKGEFKCID